MRSGRFIVWYSGRLLMSDDLSRGGRAERRAKVSQDVP